MIGIGDVYLAQEDGGLPTSVAAGIPPGESGVSIFQPAEILEMVDRSNLVLISVFLLRAVKLAEASVPRQGPAA
jgi:hypothetical protein